MDSKTKIAIVTGGSRGLGQNMAITLAKKGIDIILTYNHSEEEAKNVVKEIEEIGQKAMCIRLDIRNISTFDKFADQVMVYLNKTYGSHYFDFLINNAGTALYSPVMETTELQFDDAVNIHYKGVFFLTQKMLPYINEGGSIVNLSSTLGRVSFPGMSVYGALKGAISVHTRFLAQELGERSIRVNAIAPGAITTDFGGGMNKTAETANIVKQLTALNRLGNAQDVGSVVAFLCSDESGWVNGQTIEVSGGQSL